jgi:pimeloyl-ACP methyl ester carboxylesterase
MAIQLSRAFGWAVVLVFWFAGCTATTSRPVVPGEPAIQLADCQLSSPAAQKGVRARCGTLAVPEDRGDPSGQQIALHVVVVPAVSRSPEPDPLFMLAGGPGQAASEAYPAILSTAFARVRRDRDIVLVDQRGTGKSNPLECDLPEGQDTSEEEVVAALKACPGTLDADPRFYTTGAAVQDLDDARAALGYERINLYGASYGTRVALTYLHRYPARVRAVVLDGVVSPDFRIYLTAGQDATQAMYMLFERCRADAACQETFPDLQFEFESLLEELQAEPVEVRIADPVSGEPIAFTMTGERFAAMAFAALYAPEITSLLPLSIHVAYADGNFAPLVAQVVAVDAGLYQGLFYAVACTEDASFIVPEEAAALGEGTYFGDMSKTMRQVCEAWPRGQLGPDFGVAVSSDVPVLLLSGQADPITPPRYAERVAQTLPNSLHLVAPGMGHGIVSRGCVPGIVADFIQAASAQGLDTACVQSIEPSPFFLSFSGPKP